jgi:regulatory protein
MHTSFSKEEKLILEKIKSYCQYQERYTKEVRKKLYSLKTSTESIEKIISFLTNKDFLSDERFTQFFIQGKLRIKKWGKIKLKYELKSRGINYKLVDTYLKNISDDEYVSYFEEFSSNKIKFLKGTLDQKKRSFINYFTYRGWENDLIYQKLRDIN